MSKVKKISVSIIIVLVGNFMKTFRVGIWEEHSGYMVVKAKTKRQAEKKALEQVEELGIDSIKNFDITHRNVELV